MFSYRGLVSAGLLLGVCLLAACGSEPAAPPPGGDSEAPPFDAGGGATDETNGQGDSTDEETSPGGATAEGEQPYVAFLSNNTAEFWTIAQRGTEKAAVDFNARVEFRMPPQGTAAEQREIIEDLLNKGVQGIALSPNDAENQAPFLDEVAERCALLTQDSDLPPGSKRLCYIGTNNYEAGRAAGELVREVLPDGGRIVIFVGKLDVQNAVERRQGVMDALAGAMNAEGPQLGKYVLLDTLTDDVQEDKCRANVEDALTKYAGERADDLCLVGLWAYNPPIMLACVLERQLEGQVKLVGFDENEETLQGIQDGHIHGTIVQDPFNFGYEAVRILAGLARGDRSVLPEGGVMFVPHRVIQRDNVEAFHEQLRQLKGEAPPSA